jgi:hypothetical protein
MAMSDHKVIIFNLIDRYVASKGFHLSATPEMDPVTKLRKFTFAKGTVTRTLSLFEDDLIRDATSGTLSANTKTAIDVAHEG